MECDSSFAVHQLPQHQPVTEPLRGPPLTKKAPHRAGSAPKVRWPEAPAAVNRLQRAKRPGEHVEKGSDRPTTTRAGPPPTPAEREGCSAHRTPQQRLFCESHHEETLPPQRDNRALPPTASPSSAHAPRAG